jgi:hypothetical protein
MTYEALSSGEHGPLCPYTASVHTDDPHAARHRQAVEIINSVYRQFASRRNADGEYIDREDEDVYELAVLDQLKWKLGFLGKNEYEFDYMHLYSTAVTPMSKIRTREWVQSWWFQCQGCGFVLPATVVKQ